MIVRAADESVLLITQPDHAQMARRVMASCVPLASHARCDDILHAIGEHDGGWAEPDSAPSVDLETGDIADFVRLPLPARHDVWRRGVSRLMSRPWTAALVAHHAITVYERYRSDPAWATFFSDMEAARADMIDASGRGADALAADYVFLRLGDLISLAFCTNAREPQTIGEWTVALRGTRVSVTPDVFGAVVVPIAIAARRLPARRWASDTELRQALADAPWIELSGTVAGTA